MSDDAAEKREAEYGYREVSAKAHRLNEWSFRRDARSFGALVNRLRVKKWTREVYAEAGERLATLRAVKLAFYRRDAAANPEKYRSRDKAARRAKYKAAPLVFSCIECGAVWCKAPWTKGPRPQFCGDACRQRHRYQHDEAFRARCIAAARATHAKRRAS